MITSEMIKKFDPFIVAMAQRNKIGKAQWHTFKRMHAIDMLFRSYSITHVGKYDRAVDRPKLASLAANVGYRYWTYDRSRLG